MAEHGQVGVRERPADPVRLVFLQEIETAMDGTDDEIKHRQDLVGIVQRPIHENIGFDALEDADTRQLLLDRRDLRMLRADTILLEAVGVERRLTVIGDADIPIPERFRSTDHVFDRGGTVAIERVSMKKPSDLSRLKQNQQPAGLRELDFAVSLAKLGDDVRQPRGSVNRVFAAAFGMRSTFLESRLKQCDMLGAARRMDKLPPIL